MIWREHMHGYLSAAESLLREVMGSFPWTLYVARCGRFSESEARGKLIFEKQKKSKDKYTTVFSCGIEAIVLIILQLFCNAREKLCTNTAWDVFF